MGHNLSGAELEGLLCSFLLTPAGRMVEEFYPGASLQRHIALRTSLALSMAAEAKAWLMRPASEHD